MLLLSLKVRTERLIFVSSIYTKLDSLKSILDKSTIKLNSGAAQTPSGGWRRNHRRACGRNSAMLKRIVSDFLALSKDFC